MKRTLTFFAAMAITSSVVAAPSQKPVVANLAAAEGTVMVNQGETFVTAELGQDLYVGDRVLVMEGGKAAVKFSDGCDLALDDATMIVVSEKSTCAGASANEQKVGAQVAQAVGEVNESRTKFWNGSTWVFLAAGAVIVHNVTTGKDNVVSP